MYILKWQSCAFHAQATNRGNIVLPFSSGSV